MTPPRLRLRRRAVPCRCSRELGARELLLYTTAHRQGGALRDHVPLPERGRHVPATTQPTCQPSQTTEYRTLMGNGARSMARSHGGRSKPRAKTPPVRAWRHMCSLRRAVRASARLQLHGMPAGCLCGCTAPDCAAAACTHTPSCQILRMLIAPSRRTTQQICLATSRALVELHRQRPPTSPHRLRRAPPPWHNHHPNHRALASACPHHPWSIFPRQATGRPQTSPRPQRIFCLCGTLPMPRGLDPRPQSGFGETRLGPGGATGMSDSFGASAGPRAPDGVTAT